MVALGRLVDILIIDPSPAMASNLIASFKTNGTAIRAFAGQPACGTSAP
jgi:hypothetical protein